MATVAGDGSSSNSAAAVAKPAATAGLSAHSSWGHAARYAANASKRPRPWPTHVANTALHAWEDSPTAGIDTCRALVSAFWYPPRMHARQLLAIALAPHRCAPVESAGTRKPHKSAGLKGDNGHDMLAASPQQLSAAAISVLRSLARENGPHALGLPAYTRDRKLQIALQTASTGLSSRDEDSDSDSESGDDHDAGEVAADDPLNDWIYVPTRTLGRSPDVWALVRALADESPPAPDEDDLPSSERDSDSDSDSEADESEAGTLAYGAWTLLAVFCDACDRDAADSAATLAEARTHGGAAPSRVPDVSHFFLRQFATRPASARKLSGSALEIILSPWTGAASRSKRQARGTTPMDVHGQRDVAMRLLSHVARLAMVGKIEPEESMADIVRSVALFDSDDALEDFVERASLALDRLFLIRFALSYLDQVTLPMPAASQEDVSQQSMASSVPAPSPRKTTAAVEISPSEDEVDIISTSTPNRKGRGGGIAAAAAASPARRRAAVEAAGRVDAYYARVAHRILEMRKTVFNRVPRTAPTAETVDAYERAGTRALFVKHVLLEALEPMTAGTNSSSGPRLSASQASEARAAIDLATAYVHAQAEQTRRFIDEVPGSDDVDMVDDTFRQE